MSRRLRRTQDWLYAEFAWPRLRVSRDVALLADTRFYSYPAGLDLESITQAWVRGGGSDRWERITFGITPDHLNTHDSDSGATSWPVLAWGHAPPDTAPATGTPAPGNPPPSAASPGLLEVWPIPSRDGTLRLEGRQALATLAADTDVSTLDANLIVLFAAADLLARQKSQDAQLKLTNAQRLLRRIQAQQAADKSAPIVIGGGVTQMRRLRPWLDYIPTRGG